VRNLCIGVAVLSLGVRVAMLLTGAAAEAIYEFSITRMDALALGGAAATAMRDPQLARRIASQRRFLFATALAVPLGGAALTRD